MPCYVKSPTGCSPRLYAMDAAIYAEGLVKRFGQTTALAGADLEVKQGTVLGLLGPNGAGKTTAVRVLATLLEPDAGKAIVGGYDVLRQGHCVRQLIGLTGQYASVDETLTGDENLTMIGRLYGLPKRRAKERARELLAQFQLEHAAGRAAKTYSGGMRRRLDLASSLVGDPRILFLDEPTTGLDPRSRNQLWRLIRELVAGGVTVLLTTQYLDEADQLADRIAVIDGGKVVAEGTPEALKARVGNQVLTVRPADEAQLPVVVEAVASLAGAAPEVEGSAVSVPAPDRALLPAVVRRLDDEGVALAELAMRRATLDEVFLTLTGHRTETPADEGDGEGDAPR
jgi:oleandomycin transport system ATP-binding protein